MDYGRRVLLLALLLLTTTTTTAAPPWALASRGTPQDAGAESRGEDLIVQVITFGPGDDITEWFGHAALVVEDKRLNEARLYNYGEYSFDETMVRRYALGHLEFTVGERPVEKTLQLYGSRDRDVRVQTLSLSSAQKLELAARLADNVKPENRRYRYDHYADNCTTRVRDILDVVTGGQLQAQVRPGTHTLRELTRAQTAVSPTMSWLIDFILNDSTDRPLTTWEEGFLPEQFESQLRAATLTDDAVTRPLVQAESTWWKSSRAPLPTPWSTTSWAVAGVVGAVVLVLLRRAGRGGRGFGVVVAFVGFVFGAVGTVLFVMATFTDHHVTRGNENLLLASPLTLLLVPAGLWVALGKSRTPLRAVATSLAVLASAAVLLKALPSFDQENARALALLVPLWWGVAVGARAAPRAL